MEKETAIEYINSQKSDNFEIIVVGKESENEYFTKEIGKAVGQAYQQTDDVLTKLGLDKQGKTSESVEFHFTAMSKKIEKLADVEKSNSGLLEEIETLKKNGVSDKDILAQLEKSKEDYKGIQDKLTTVTEEHKTALSKNTSELNSFKINSLIRASLPADLKGEKDYINFKTNQAILNIKDNYDVSLKEDGTIEISKEHMPFKAEDLLKESLKDLIGKYKSGLGVGGQESKITIANASTKGELIAKVNEQLKAENLTPTMSKYHDRQQELLKENNFSDKPE